MSGGGDSRGKVTLPWLNMVVSFLPCTWTRTYGMTISEAGKRVIKVWDPLGTDGWYLIGAVAKPRATEGRHWFEVRLVKRWNDGVYIGWTNADVHLEEHCIQDALFNKRGCAW